MKFRKNIILLLSIVIILLLSSCGGTSTSKTKVPTEAPNYTEVPENINQEGMPIVKEPITLNFFTKDISGATTRWNDVYLLNKYEEMTNIDINWEQSPVEYIDEKKNILLVTGDYPDVFFASDWSAPDIFKYGEQGVFIPLNDLIELHAPHLQKLLEENPEIRKAITFPDGNIYSLPAINWETNLMDRIGAVPYVRQDFLSILGMTTPRTTDELSDYLLGVRDEISSNGNTEIIPFGGANIEGIISWINGAFGLGNRGANHPFIDSNPNQDGEIRFIPASNEYKEMLAYVHTLYKENLIDSDIFSISVEEFFANGAAGRLASYHGFNPIDSFGEAIGEKTIAALPLEGPYGKGYNAIRHPVVALGQFLITDKNQHPIETIKWIDYFYSDEGSKFWHLGVKDETYNETAEGYNEYTTMLTDDPDWGINNLAVIEKYLVWPGMNAPGIVKKENMYKEEEEESAKYDAFQSYIPEETWPTFTYTTEEIKVLNHVGADLSKYVMEMRDKFIAGYEPLTNWDTYIQTLESIGLEEYMDIQREAVKRYESN